MSRPRGPLVSTARKPDTCAGCPGGCRRVGAGRRRLPVAGPQTTEQVVFRVERAIGVLCVVLALGGALAGAGTYEVAICHDPTTGLTTSTDGMSFPTSGSSAEAGVYDGCGSAGYLFATLDGTASYSVIESAAWEFQAPSGTNIAAVQLWRAFYTAESTSDPPPLDAFEKVSSSG